MSLRRLRMPRGILTAGQKSAEGVRARADFLAAPPMSQFVRVARRAQVVNLIQTRTRHRA